MGPDGLILIVSSKIISKAATKYMQYVNTCNMYDSVDSLGLSCVMLVSFMENNTIHRLVSF